MDSLQETLRQIRIALFAVIILLAIGTMGFMAVEGFSFLESIWLTVITLATVGYGDIYARTDNGRVFTIFLILIGLSVFAFGIQATATFLVSPVIRNLRARNRIQHRIDRLSRHYILCGTGDLVDRCIASILKRAESRRRALLEQRTAPVDALLDRLLPSGNHERHLWLRRPLRRAFVLLTAPFHRDDTLLNAVVAITHDARYAEHLRQQGLLVIEGEATDDAVLHSAGVERALAMMVMLEDDTETILSVLAARSLNTELYITATALDERLARRMVRVGANNVAAPFEIAGQMLNNATLRPAVSSFFRRILFDLEHGLQATQLLLWDDSPWIGHTLAELELRRRFNAGVIGIRRADGHFHYAPDDEYRLQEEEIVIAVAPGHDIPALQADCRRGVANKPHRPLWERLPMVSTPPTAEHPVYSLVEAAEVIEKMAQHYVICGTGRVMHSAVSKLDPTRPFVIVSSENGFTSDLIKQGFRVVHGSPTQENTLRAAGIERALAVMVCLEDKAESILTVINCRALSKRLLITATAYQDEMHAKLLRAGADRVASPFDIAAQYVLLSTTRPSVSDFLQYVLYNQQHQLETTELYMQGDALWIGETIARLNLRARYNAAVIGVRTGDGRYLYAPPADHVIQRDDVLIVVTPMRYADDLRASVHGGITRRPETLRVSVRPR